MTVSSLSKITKTVSTFSENTLRWDLVILTREARELQREYRHLSTKAKQRPLTLWEQLRLHESVSELDEVFFHIQELQQ